MTIPVVNWAKDHWSTFAYIETCCVDHKGQIDFRRMRMDGNEFPTRCASGRLEPGHTDMDCADDMEKAGLLVNYGTWANPVFKLTTLGQEVASALRAHTADGGAFVFFCPHKRLQDKMLKNQGLKLFQVTVVRREHKYQRVTLTVDCELSARREAEELLEHDDAWEGIEVQPDDVEIQAISCEPQDE